MSLATNVKVYVESLGVILGLAGLVFVILKFSEYWVEIESQIDVSFYNISFIAALAIGFAFLNFFLALGWYKICRSLHLQLKLSTAVGVYAQSQLAKYVPGNVFQFVGRQALMVARGHPNKPVAKTTIYELILLITIGITFLIPVLLSIFTEQSHGFILFIFIIFWAITLCSIGVYFDKFMAFATLGYSTFLFGTGVVFLLTLGYFGDAEVIFQSFFFVITSYVIAWLAGLLTPGAPAGIGIREVVLVYLLGGVAPEGIVLASVLISRMINVVGDMLFFIFGSMKIARHKQWLRNDPNA